MNHTHFYFKFRRFKYTKTLVMPHGGLSGGYGTMPIELLLKKQELSCVPEQLGGDQLHDYFRSELKTIGPDKPLFESDLSRDGRESTGTLNLRYHGGRSTAKPDLPDGTFLDWEGTHRDPRSLMLEPDGRKTREQALARAKFINFYNDEDYSIPESVIAPAQMVKNIRGAQYEVANRLKIFSTSKTGFHNGSGLQRSTINSTHGKTYLDQKTPAVSDFTLANRRNKTTSLSNDTTIGWRSGVDHEFKVSSYGRLPSGKVRNAAAWNRQRKNTRTGHEIFTQIEGRPVPNATARMIIDLANLNHNKHKANSHANYGSSSTQKTTAQRRVAEDLIRSMYDVKESRSVDPHTDINGEVVTRSKRRLTEIDDKKTKSVINPTIVEKMASANKRIKERDQSDLRASIQQSAEDDGIYVEDFVRNTITSKQLEDPSKLRRSAIYDFERGKEHKVAQYKHANLKSDKSRMSDLAFEVYGSQSKNQGQKSRFHGKPKIQQVGTTNVDIKYGEERSGTHTKGPLGSKNTRRFHSFDHVTLDVNDQV